jgi:hypothetical protein
MASVLVGEAFINSGDSQGFSAAGLGFNAVIEAQPLDPGASLVVSQLTARLDGTGALNFDFTVTNNSQTNTFYNILGAWNL